MIAVVVPFVHMVAVEVVALRMALVVHMAVVAFEDHIDSGMNIYCL
jgi:hypothetical protein